MDGDKARRPAVVMIKFRGRDPSTPMLHVMVLSFAATDGVER